MTKRKRKVVGWKVPCKKGKRHTTNMVTGICKYCNKQVEEPKPYVRELERTAAKIIFGK